MKVAIVLPVFNHAKTVAAVVGEVRARLGEMGAEKLIVVDDGCTDGTSEVLAGMPAAADIVLLRHEKNRGKGHALMTGFKHAASLGYTHAATIDADGQHDTGDLVNLIAEAREHPEELIIGMRDMDKPNCPVPAASRKGRDFSRFWMRVHTGRMIPDTQCGLRVYPLKPVLACQYWFWRYDFETEVLARMAWGGVAIRNVPIRCIYFAAEERVSHFRPVRDTLRGIRVNLFLLLRRLAPVPFKRLSPREDARVKFGKWWKAATWREAFAGMLRAGSSNAELSAAFAVGIFVGLTPFYMLQTIIAIYFARRLHLNVLAAVVGSQISIPPLVPVWVMLSYGVGNLLLHGRWMDASFAEMGHGMVPALLLGNLLVAAGAAVIGFVAARTVLHVVRSESGKRMANDDVRITNQIQITNDAMTKQPVGAVK